MLRVGVITLVPSALGLLAADQQSVPIWVIVAAAGALAAILSGKVVVPTIMINDVRETLRLERAERIAAQGEVARLNELIRGNVVSLASATGDALSQSSEALSAATLAMASHKRAAK